MIQSKIGFAATLVFSCIASIAQAQIDPGSAPQQFAQLGDLKLENHGVIHDCAIGYRTIGKLNADKSNAVLFLPWHTASSDSRRWCMER